MRGVSSSNVKGWRAKAGKTGLIILYALTFYFGPHFQGIKVEKSQTARYAEESYGGASGWYMIDIFNQQFEMNDL